MTSAYGTREYVFAALIAAALLVTGSLVIPLTLPLGIPGLANAAVAPVSSIFLVLGLTRLQRPGSLLLINGIYALVCLLISPIIPCFLLTGTLAGEALGSFVFKGYRRPAARVAAVVVHSMVMFPAASLFSYFLFPRLFRAIPPLGWLLGELGILIASLLGGLVGLKLAGELERAGKLRVPS